MHILNDRNDRSFFKRVNNTVISTKDQIYILDVQSLQFNKKLS